MKYQEKRIITAAITGAVHVRSMSPYLPITPEEISDEAAKACEAGAAIVHIHARDPKTGEPSSNLEVIKEILYLTKKKCNAIINLTTGASQMMSVDERLSCVPIFRPEMASCNAGSINFMFADMASKVSPSFDWELKYICGTRDNVFTNTFAGIEKYIKIMNEYGTIPEFEIYDLGMISNIAYFVKKGIITSPISLQFVLGITGGAPATVENLSYFKRQADLLLGQFHWSAAAAGKYQLPICAATIAMGGNVRVGLEDNLYIKSGLLAKSNAEQVEAVKTMIDVMGYSVATPDEARRILALKGNDQVAF